ncbi:MAG: hypothetical protein PHR16_14800, partial [Methylovulum sp.]|nr:hypothetical protein [Methylovulum sp.]
METLSNSPRASITVTVTPPPIKLSGDLDVDRHGRLLVLVDPLDKDCQGQGGDDDASVDGSDSHSDTRHDSQDG